MTSSIEPALLAAAKDARAWPFEEARKIVKRANQARRLLKPSAARCFDRTSRL
jgi:hypothetical protein